MRKPYDRRHISEELDHALTSAAQSSVKPLIVGFCCQYGLYGTGTLAGLWRNSSASIWIVPVLCAAKVEPDQMLRAFEMGAEGVFVASCGEQCARENTDFWVRQRVEKARRVLAQIGLEPERLRTFVSNPGNGGDPAEELNNFAEMIGGFHLASVLLEEVRS
jgi:coenzyme F420-reducing hydrogenase delta subunit